MSIKTFCLLISIIYCFEATGQENKRYVIPEILIGSIVPNYLKSPSFGVKTGLAVTYYKSAEAQTATNQYYKYPLLGVQAGFYNLGNTKVYGHEINLMPVLGLRMKKGMFQWGIGASYFTKTYRENEKNQSIGSHFNWAFQWMYYWSYDVFMKRNLRLGVGYRHSSNGHVQLPNYGLNSAVFSIAITAKELKTSRNVTRKINSNPNNRTLFIKARSGIGFHEFGNTTSPVGGEKKLVFSQSFGVGIIFNEHFRWYAGFGTRHYQHFADSINKSIELQNLNVHPNNHFFLMGVEYLIYHVGISIEGGINISKPFYYHFSERFENTESVKYTLKKLFPSRMGLKLYLINTAKNPRHNFYVATHINANFGQADFSEASLGYVLNL
ncbi:acyloxyacyl hydrolase [uncultured Marivirga sp.]|uniref:acyloxyacyl hydrolase n=1 Tax=uncultured Marivirga sp. TaxID=1123707 RepID=UPI0030EDFB75|tara:strand:+ start:176247 stop:177392 length:1146 start_codon:yes stop_codon:yes gene_type:complete